MIARLVLVLLFLLTVSVVTAFLPKCKCFGDKQRCSLLCKVYSA
jgi:hypothetical protein